MDPELFSHDSKRVAEVLGMTAATAVEKKSVEWFVKLNSPEVSSETQQDFDAWLQKDRIHQMAYERVETVWKNMDAYAESPLIEQVAEEARAEREKRDLVADNSFPGLIKGVWRNLVQALRARFMR